MLRFIGYGRVRLVIVPFVVLVLITSAACTTTVRKSSTTAGDELSRCEHLFATLDAAIIQAGVRDGAATPVNGFPYLRTDRFLAGYREEPMRPDAAAWWVRQMQRLDGQARRTELANLPQSYRPRLPAELRQLESLNDRLTHCADLLVGRDLADPSVMEQLRVAADVPDDYETWKRALGLYPVTALAFLQGVSKYQSDTRATITTPLDGLPVVGGLIGYEPAEAPERSTVSPAAALERSRGNPLGVPIPEGRDLVRLFAVHAPLFEVDTLDRNDRIGTPVLGEQGTAHIDTSSPTVFVRITHARYRGRPLLQLVYSIWFPGRPKTGKLDLLGGHLDGVVWRVTLDDDGEPLLYDTMHSCGCYHMFFPTPRVRLRQNEPAFEEPVLVPTRLGLRHSGERIVIRIAAGTHFIQNVRYHSGLATEERRDYSFANDDRLRSLAWPGKGRRSLYRPDGIVPGSERGERYFYWPMGVREPGAMRQWGRHATAFVGRRHFDDPNLIERYFKR